MNLNSLSIIDARRGLKDKKFFKLILEKIDFTIVAQFYAEETKKISLDLRI